jgi:hypothetical protein
VHARGGERENTKRKKRRGGGRGGGRGKMIELTEQEPAEELKDIVEGHCNDTYLTCKIY